MGNKCTISRNIKGQIQEIYAPNKKPSKLFKSALRVAKSTLSKVNQNQTVEQIEQQRKAEIERFVTNIFPDTKVKQVVYHGGSEEITKFDKKFIDIHDEDSGEYGKGFYFSTDKEYVDELYNIGSLQSILLNSKNPLNQSSFNKSIVKSKQAKELGYDAIRVKDSNDQIVVFEPEQIRILTPQELQKIDEINAKYDLEILSLKGISKLVDEKINQLLKNDSITKKCD
jgi:hypothetical protein